MTTDERTSFLRKNYLFERLPDNDILLIAESMGERNIPERTMLIEQDTLDTVVYFIVSGEVRVYRSLENGDALPIGHRGENDLVGEMALFNNFKRMASVESTKPCVLLTLSAESFLKLIYSNPEIAVFLLQAFARQLFELGADVGTRVTDNLIERTRSALMKFEEASAGGNFKLEVDDLSTIVGATRLRMIDVLKDLEQEGRIKLQKDSIQIVKV